MDSPSSPTSDTSDASILDYARDASPLAAPFLPPIAIARRANDDHTTIDFNTKDIPIIDSPSIKQGKVMNPFAVPGHESDQESIGSTGGLELNPLNDNNNNVLPTIINPSGASLLENSNSTSSTTKLIYFEGLRGIAALQVVFIHTLNYFGILDNITRLYQQWSFAVPIFFILSGGIITRSIIQSNAEKKSTHSNLLKKLYSSFVRRPFRFLIPLYFGSIYKIILIKYFGLKVDSSHDLPESLWIFFKEPIRFLIYADGPTIPFLPVPSWTLFPEMLGSMVIYTVTAVLLPYADNPRIRYTTLAVMFLFFFFTDNWAFYFLIGYAISDMSVSGYISKFNACKHKLAIKIIMLLVACGITYEFSVRANPSDAIVQHPNPIRAQLLEWLRIAKIHTNESWNFPENSLLVFYCTVVFFLIESTPFLQRCLSITPAAYLGRISFMLYLLHQDTALMLYPMTEKWLEHGPKGYIAKFLFDMAICILVADIATRVFDEPLQKVLRRTERFILYDKWFILPLWEWPAFFAYKVRELMVFVATKVVAALNGFMKSFNWSKMRKEQ
ncbi:hypothetical protein HDU97_005298 [Phlyctochytrium planicorne]|nr:hypothetical protein HDU97_005298 [Phlyctochytrium planicorne]